MPTSGWTTQDSQSAHFPCQNRDGLPKFAKNPSSALEAAAHAGPIPPYWMITACSKYVQVLRASPAVTTSVLAKTSGGHSGCSMPCSVDWRRLRLLWPLILTSSVHVSFVHAQSITLDEALMAYEASCRSVTSFDVTVKTDNVRRLSMTVDESTLPPASDGSFPELKVQWQRISESEQSTTFIRSRQRYQNGMYRLEVLEIDGDRVDPGELLSAWDNETYKALSSTALRARIRSYARTQIESVGIAYQNSFLVFDGDYSYVDFVRDRPNRSLRVEG
jgi:hypothetical protein